MYKAIQINILYKLIRFTINFFFINISPWLKRSVRLRSLRGSGDNFMEIYNIHFISNIPPILFYNPSSLPYPLLTHVYIEICIAYSILRTQKKTTKHNQLISMDGKQNYITYNERECVRASVRPCVLASVRPSIRPFPPYLIVRMSVYFKTPIGKTDRQMD